LVKERATQRTLLQRMRLLGLRRIGGVYASGNRPPATPGGGANLPRSVLLMRPDHLGDLLFLTPALRSLRLALPDARLALLAGPWGVEAVRGNRDLDEVYLCSFPGFERGPKMGALAPYRLLYTTAAELRAGGYDTAVVLRYDHWWGAWLAATAGIPRRVGYAWPETQPFLTDTQPYVPGRHEVKQNAGLLAALAPMPEPGALGPLRYTLAPADQAWVASWLGTHRIEPGRPLIAMHPGAGASVKQWPAAAWAAVGDGLARDAAAQILLTGGPGEQALTRSVTEHMTCAPHDLAGQTTLGQLAALQARCTLVLGSDSGPLHLAVAAGAPTIHLYGPVSAGTFGPWGDPDRQRVITSPWACVPCNRLDWSTRAQAYHACLAAITPERVLAEANEMIRLEVEGR
jgi:lipopolysaccharide heptosyltransferase II